MHPRAQSSVELLIVLAISIILLSILVNVTTSQISQLKTSHSLNVAQQSLSSLILTINQAWGEGPGTVRFATLRWPDGVDGNEVWILGNSIILSVYDTNITGSAIPRLTGVLTVYPGEQEVKITVNDSNVSLGTLSITADQSSVYIPLEQDSNARTTLTITNLAPIDANVSYTLTWAPTLVGVSRSPATDVLSPNESGEVDLNVSASATAFGNYVGQLYVSADYNSTMESLTIPINVEVFASSSGLLEAFPSTLIMGALPGDTNTSIMQVCNSGDSTLSGITFTPSDGDAGEWVQSISSISSLAANTCQNVNITVSIPGGSSEGEYTGSLLIGDSTGANTDIISLSVSVFSQGDYFSWDWNTTTMGASTLSGFGWRNWGSDPLAITSMVIQRWSECDTNGSTLTSITANGSTVFSGNVSDGGTSNVTDFNIPATTAYTNNSLTFNGTINDENEQFQGIVTFSDSSTYSSTAYGTGCGNDSTPPARVSDLIALAGPEPGTMVLQFTLPGDNNYSGTATEAEIKMFRQPDANNPSVYASGTALSYGTIGPGGTAGSLTVTDLNVGETYFFTAVFRDEVDNNGGLSNIASGRPLNRFRWAGNDFNITNFAHSLSADPPVGQPWDVNLFTISDFNFGSNRDRNVQFRITPDNNSDNSWIIYLGIQNTVVNSIKIWYPIAAQDSLPSRAADYSANPGATASSPLDLLSASLINSTYRYNGSSVSVPRPNHLYVSWMRNINDFNLMFDMNQALYS